MFRIPHLILWWSISRRESMAEACCPVARIRALLLSRANKVVEVVIARRPARLVSNASTARRKENSQSVREGGARVVLFDGPSVPHDPRSDRARSVPDAELDNPRGDIGPRRRIAAAPYGDGRRVRDGNERINVIVRLFPA